MTGWGNSERSWIGPAAVAFFLALAGMPAVAGAQQVGLDQFSLNRLLDIDITSVSKRSQQLQGVASSVYIITEEDIHRSGATRVQDVLKMTPGGWFADDSYTISAVGVREGAHPFSQTQLWILDGVPITNPTTGGVIFDILDLPLADIQRIEVIKGPGGTIYGANAVTGIISIFTKDGERSQGLHAVLEGGTQGYLAPYIRYGYEPKENFFLSAWAKFKNHEGYDRNPMFSGDSLLAPTKFGALIMHPNSFFPVAPDDDQKAISFGAKWDFQPWEKWRWSGGISRSDVRSGKYNIVQHPWPDSAPADPAAYRQPPPSEIPDEDHGVQVVARTRVDYMGEYHALFLNAYHWRHDLRWMGGPGFNDDFDVSDLELQDNVQAYKGHRINIGANMRRVYFRFTNPDGSRSSNFVEPDLKAYLFGTFLQDELTLGTRWRLTLGAKAETWTLISPVPEISPSLRLAYRPTPDLTFWAAASRSITTPSHAHSDMEIPVQQVPPPWYFQAQGVANPPPAAGAWAAIVGGGTDVKPTDYYTLEAGGRGWLGSLLQWDGSGFYSWVRDQISVTPFDASLQTVVPSRVNAGGRIVPLYYTNIYNYESFGGEGLIRLFPIPLLRLELSYALFWKYHVLGREIPGDTSGRIVKEEDLHGEPRWTPRHVGRVKAYLDLPWDVDFSLFGILSSPFMRGTHFNYITQRPDPIDGVEVGKERAQFQLDAILQRAFYRDRITATLWGRNLLASKPYTEFYNQYVWSTYPHQVHWTFGGGLEYRF
ncbi:MAG: ligand-gated TonB-dependent outer rane channel [Fibrobacteres bacterium]|nr:ligand-gated TonB-dependent outer rane channel [Fibrobacterota bacterium]